MLFSANIGFLYTDLPLPDRIRAAKRAGFDAVECHFPYDVPVAEMRAANYAVDRTEDKRTPEQAATELADAIGL